MGLFQLRYKAAMQRIAKELAINECAHAQRFIELSRRTVALKNEDVPIFVEMCKSCEASAKYCKQDTGVLIIQNCIEFFDKWTK